LAGPDLENMAVTRLVTEKTSGSCGQPSKQALVHARADANGKLILLGEHSVVYGMTALAVGLPDALRVKAVPSDSIRLELSVPGWDLYSSDEDNDIVGELLRFVRDKFPVQCGYRLLVETWLPCRAGLGSSAALCVGLLKALSSVLGKELPKVELNDLAKEAERIFHGIPSGIDNTTSVFGGACLFLGKGHVSPPAGFDSLGAGLSGAYTAPVDLRLVIGNTGIPRNTKKVVEDVRRMQSMKPAWFKSILEEMDHIALEGARASVAADPAGLGKAMKKNHGLLREIGVSHPMMDLMVDRAMRAGALGAKLTGAGRGGCVVALVPGGDTVVQARVLKYWNDLGAGCRTIDTGPVNMGMERGRS